MQGACHTMAGRNIGLFSLAVEFLDDEVTTLSKHKTLQILHIDTEYGWRGGQNQVRLLCEGLCETKAADCHLATVADGELSKRINSKVRLVPLSSNRGWQPITAWRLARYCKEHDIQILHAHSSHAHDLALLIKLWAPHIKLVVHRRVDYSPAANFISRHKYRSSLIDRYICVSHAIARVLENTGVHSSRIAVVHSAVSKGAITTNAAQNLRADLLANLGADAAAPLLVNVAALTEQKDHATLLRALARLKVAGTRFTCVIAGEGKLRKSLQAQCQQLQLNDQVHFLGQRNDAQALIAAADIFVLSSQDEGLGTVLLEAALVQKCIVATAVGGIPEIVIDGQGGLLAARGADQALAMLLQMVIDDPALRAQLAQQAYHHVEQNFSVNKMLAGNLKIYQDLVS